MAKAILVLVVVVIVFVGYKCVKNPVMALPQ